jgi:SAM-dependent methyltransferase
VDPTWKDATKVDEYVGRVGRLAARRAGETELVEALPSEVEQVVDLGCGDGRLLALVLDSRATVAEATGLDNSPPMLDLARKRFRLDSRVAIRSHDLGEPLPDLGVVDLVVSGFAIHHLSHDRKRSLFGEIAALLRPGGVFANLEVVQCSTAALHAEFNRRIGKPDGDPEDVLAEVEPQLTWMRDSGLTQVDCYWRWRGFALLVGEAPAAD